MKPVDLRLRYRWPWGIFVAMLVLTWIGIAFLVLGRNVSITTLWGFRGIPVVFALTYGFIGAWILSYQKTNAIGWIFLSFGLVSSLDLIGEEYFTYSYYIAKQPLPAGQIAAWLSSWVWVLQTVPLLTFLPLLFPTSRLPSVRWRPVAAGAFLVMIWMAISVIFDPDLEARSSVIKNPFGLPTYDKIITASFLLSLVVGIILSSNCLASLFYRYRKGTIHEKQQIKWFMYACIIALIFAVPALYSGKAWEYIFTIAALGIPISVGISILNYQLFDIDLIIRRTLVYGVLTALMGVIYFSSVVLLQRIFVLTTAEESPAAIFISTLAIATLFSPLRRRIQAFIDQRFYRQRYEAQHIIEEFSASLRNAVSLDDISRYLLAIIEETFHPQSMGLWIQPLQNRRKDNPIAENSSLGSPVSSRQAD